MAAITAYRVQDQCFGIGNLLDPERMSFAMSGDDELARHGVSCMEDLPSLAAYIASDAEIVTDDDAFFSLVGDLVDLHYEQGVDFEDLREIASDRI